MVGLDGEKMSKSKGNLELVSRLRQQGVDAMAIRLALLAHHYRSDWEWEAAGLEQAQTLLERLRGAVARDAGAPSAPVVEAVLTALATDLDAPGALITLNTWATATEAGDVSEPGAGDVVRALADAALGVAL
jgi:L-cysteine:1D-myo-inositol 2-amino-2-deoxy-alpha-D-glucopyranoside ligase